MIHIFLPYAFNIVVFMEIEPAGHAADEIDSSVLPTEEPQNEGLFVVFFEEKKHFCYNDSYFSTLCIQQIIARKVGRKKSVSKEEE